MLITVWGRDGIGKSTLCDALGELFSKQGITLVIDTDLTQASIPGRLRKSDLDTSASLGKVVSGTGGGGDIARYWHQHAKNPSLFYAGLTDSDDYLSYELGLEAINSAVAFLEECTDMADTVIVDLSGQRYDPFLPSGLAFSDRALIALPPDLHGVSWFNGVKPLLNLLQVQETALPIGLPLVQPCDVTLVEKSIAARFSALLPYAHELRQTRDAGVSPLDGSTPSAIRYARAVYKLYGAIKGGAEE